MEAQLTALPVHGLQTALARRSESLQSRLLTTGDAGGKTDGAPRQETAELASLFILQMLQAMRRTIPKSGLLDQGFAHELYESFFDQEVAKQMSRREDVGLTSLLIQEFRGRGRGGVPVESKLRALEAYQHLPRAQMDTFAFPVAGRGVGDISSPHGWRQDPLGEQQRFHRGMDIAAPSGSVVSAAAPGTVTFSGRQNGYGNLVIVDHADGYQTVYAHNAKNLVEVGDEVSRAQAIALVGASGRATGPHLHFEIRKDGQPLDPMTKLHGQSRR